MKKWNGILLSIILVGIISIISLTGCSLVKKNEAIDDTKNEVINSGEESKSQDDDIIDTNDDVTPTEHQTQDVSYIKDIDIEKKTITIDQVELLFSTDEERLNEIGMKSEDLMTGFYIYNEDENEKLLTYDDMISIELLEETSLKEASLEELEELLQQHDVLCKISIKDNVVAKISEQYLP